MTRQRPRVTNHKPLRKLISDQSGGVAALVALLSPVLIGAMGLGAETGYWYLTARKLQNAADVAAHATAVRMGQGDQQAALQNMAEYIVGQSDVNMTQTAVGIATPPTSGAYIEDQNAVEITLNQTIPRLFSAIYDSTPVQISARAVATMQGNGSAACILALANNPGGQGVDIADRARVGAIECDIVSNETGDAAIEFHRDSDVTANCVKSAGDAITDGSLSTTCSEVEENAAPVSDPFASLVEPNMIGGCQDKTLEDETVTPTDVHPSGMASRRFCAGMEIKGNVTLEPGLYIIQGGDLKVEGGANLTANGVTFYVAQDVQTTFDMDATFNVSPPTTGPYAGITFFSSRNASGRKHVIAGRTGSVFDGAMYAATSRFEFFGMFNTSFSGCTQIVGDDIEFKNDVVMQFHCLFPTGALGPSGDGMVAIVE